MDRPASGIDALVQEIDALVQEMGPAQDADSPGIEGGEALTVCRYFFMRGGGFHKS